MNLLANSLELLEVHYPRLVRVVKGENAPNPILCLSLSHPRANYVEELVELNGAIDISQGVDEAQNEGISLVEA